MLRKEKVQWLNFLHAIHAKALRKHFVNIIGNKLENWNLFFSFFNFLAIIYTGGWIQNLSEGGLVTSQLQCGTAGIIREVGSALDEAFREHQ